ncbi:MAG: NAD(P)/FAD-dependent oxidoreductase [Thermodesulfobacteriota bacterium]|nr:NAD(P)/FAD-dependent oxidoreductase [Thermodesulfobacteriota bacterium]
MFGKIAVIGAGPAGSRLSSLLSKQGRNVTLYESKAPDKEKPCAGGLTCKVFSDTGIPKDLPIPARPLTSSKVISWDDTSVDVTLEKGITVVGRRDFDRYLLEQALEKGARFVNDRVISLERASHGWTLFTRSESEKHDFVVGADGANSLIRKTVASRFRVDQCYKACGYFIRGLDETNLVIKFFHDLEGYAWIFPGVEHASAGICGTGHKYGTSDLKRRLSKFLACHYSEDQLQDKKPFAWLIPSLSHDDLDHLKIAGNDWALAGDAAGLADPITGEGIFYAIKSAEALAECLLNDSTDGYVSKIYEQFTRNLARAASLKKLFFSPGFVENTVLLARASPAIRGVLSDLYTGAQDYLSLEQRLVTCIVPCVKDMLSPQRLPSLARALFNIGRMARMYRQEKAVE